MKDEEECKFELDVFSRDNFEESDAFKEHMDMLAEMDTFGQDTFREKNFVYKDCLTPWKVYRQIGLHLDGNLHSHAEAMAGRAKAEEQLKQIQRQMGRIRRTMDKIESMETSNELENSPVNGFSFEVVEPVLEDVIEVGYAVLDEPVEPLEFVFHIGHFPLQGHDMTRRLTLSAFSARRAVREPRIPASRSG